MSDGDSEEEEDNEFFILPELANCDKSNELFSLQSQCFKHREELCHRFYSYQPIFLDKCDQIDREDDDEPQQKQS